MADDERYVKDEDGKVVTDSAGNALVKPEFGGPVAIDGIGPAEYYAKGKKTATAPETGRSTDPDARTEDN